MELIRTLPAFLVACALLSALPGPAIAVLLRRSAIGGRQEGIAVVAGLEVGLYAWVLAAGAGLAALVAASHVAATVERVAGAVVLLFLGIQALRAAVRKDEAVPDTGPGSGRGFRAAFATGLMTNLANPKAAVFAFAFYPQFVPHGYPAFLTIAGLGLLHITQEFVLYSLLASGAARAGRWFSRRIVRRTLDATAGTVLVGLGVRVAASQP